MRPSFFAAVVVVGFTSACGAIIGIGDLPAPSEAGTDAAASDTTPSTDASDVAVDSPSEASIACEAGKTPCAGSCVDLTNDSANCGACQNVCATVTGGNASCVGSVCKLSVDEQAHKNWSTSAPGPWLAIWKDGTILSSSSGSNSSSVLDATSGTATPFLSGADMQARPTIYIPSTQTSSDGGARVEAVYYHWGSFDAYDQAHALLWSNGVHGCCGGGEFGFTVDPGLGLMFTGHTMTVFYLDDSGADTFYQYAGPDAQIYATSSWIYLAGADGYVYKMARSNLSTTQWKQPIGSGASANVASTAALTSSEGIVTLSATAGILARFEPNGSSPWQVDVVSPSAGPIVTSKGLVVLGEVSGELPSLCAHDGSTGSATWCTPVADAVTDLLAGDDGILYVAIANQAAVYGYDATTGVLRYTFSNVPYPVEMVLRGGKIFAYGSGELTSLDVPATQYDSSSWPVKHHDNQRTNSTVTPLTY